MRLLVKNDRVIGSLPDHDHETDMLCVKGRFGISELVNHPGRLQRPAIIDQQGGLPVTWEEAIKLATEKMDVTLLTPIYLGTRQVNLRDVRNVKTPADLKGVKLRMPGSKEWLFLGEALGATATPLAFGEVYLGLKTGTIDVTQLRLALAGN